MIIHDNTGLPCKFIGQFDNLEYDDYDVICINETKFFNKLVQFCNIFYHFVPFCTILYHFLPFFTILYHFVPFCKTILSKGKTIYACGLDRIINKKNFNKY